MFGVISSWKTIENVLLMSYNMPPKKYGDYSKQLKVRSEYGSKQLAFFEIACSFLGKIL
jgi:hypothetical protein